MKCSVKLSFLRHPVPTTHHTRPLAEDDNGDDDHHDGNHDDDEILSCFKQFSVPDGVPDIVLPELYVQSTIWGEGANGEEVAKVVLAIPQALSCQVLCAGRKGAPHGANGGK